MHTSLLTRSSLRDSLRDALRQVLLIDFLKCTIFEAVATIYVPSTRRCKTVMSKLTSAVTWTSGKGMVYTPAATCICRSPAWLANPGTGWDTATVPSISEDEYTHVQYMHKYQIRTHELQLTICFRLRIL